jgi:threonine dehydrogenase-like Zn-dependent dehydrogenase
VFNGRVPQSEYQRMRAPFMAGNFPFPVKYGYATVGRIDDDEIHGRIVFSLHPHQTVFDIPASAAVPVPDNVSPQRAVLAANMETALNAVWDAAPGPSGRVAVVGGGVVGALAAFLCTKIAGTDVTLIDINPARAELARQLGVDFATPESAKGERDFVFHTSASGAGLATALSLAADEATVLELSWYGDAAVPIPLGGPFHSRRLKLISSQVGKVAPLRRKNTTHAQRLSEALGLLADPRLDALLTPPVKFSELPARLPDILDPQSGTLCQIIAYE